jgi:hypothetical protein
MSHTSDGKPAVEVSPSTLEDDPRLRATLAAVRVAYDLCDALPQREHWRLAQVLRRHLRAVLRCLARAKVSVHDADRCAELERVMLHCAHLDTLWSLCADGLEWLPREATEQQRERWIGLREELAREARGLARAMTLRFGREAEGNVALVLTHSLPDTYAGPRPPVTPLELSSSLDEVASADPSPVSAPPVSDAAHTLSLKNTKRARFTSLTARTTAPLRSKRAVDVDRTEEHISEATISAEEAWTEGLGTWVDELSLEELSTTPQLMPAMGGDPR